MADVFVFSLMGSRPQPQSLQDRHIMFVPSLVSGLQSKDMCVCDKILRVCVFFSSPVSFGDDSC